MNPKHYSDMREAPPPANPTRDELFEWSQRHVVLEEERERKKRIVTPQVEKNLIDEIHGVLVEQMISDKVGLLRKKKLAQEIQEK